MPVLTKINTNVIADDAVTGAKFAGDTYLENTTTQNLSGTYAESRLYTSDAYTLTGDTTVNANLVLSSVKGDDSDITLTADSTTRTLTGTGVLSGGGTLHGRNTVTGMIGTVGSGVTGGSGLTALGTVTAGNISHADIVYPSGMMESTAIICDQKAYNADGGSFTSGAWRTRDLNTKISDVDGIVSISSNQFTLQTGTYTIDWIVPTWWVGWTVSRLYNISETAVIGYGVQSNATNNHRAQGGFANPAVVVTIASEKVFELQQRCTTTKTTDGFGYGSENPDSASVNNYAVVKIIKHTQKILWTLIFVQIDQD